MPNLIKRFYPIPPAAVNWGGENVLRIRLYGEHATGLSEPVFVREAPTEAQRRAIIDFDDDRAYLADLRNLPEVELQAQVSQGQLTLAPGERTVLRVRLKNEAPDLAFCTGLRLAGLDRAASALFSDNYFSILPGQTKTVLITLVNDLNHTGERRIRLELTGWNVKAKQIGQEMTLVLG